MHIACVLYHDVVPLDQCCAIEIKCGQHSFSNSHIKCKKKQMTLIFYLTQDVINIRRLFIYLTFFFVLNLQNLAYVSDLQHNLTGTNFNYKCSIATHSLVAAVLDSTSLDLYRT